MGCNSLTRLKSRTHSSSPAASVGCSLLLANGHQSVIFPPACKILMEEADMARSPSAITTSADSRQLPVHIRWMIRRDMPEVLAIEQECFEFAWKEDDFICCLRQRNCIGMVAEASERVVGFMVYELHKHRLHVLNFAVSERFRRRAVGSQMAK